MFPISPEFLQDSETELDALPINDIKDHLAGLSASHTKYFPNFMSKEHCWVENPFRVTERPPVFLPADCEKLMEITSDAQATFE